MLSGEGEILEGAVYQFAAKPWEDWCEESSGPKGGTGLILLDGPEGKKAFFETWHEHFRVGQRVAFKLAMGKYRAKVVDIRRL